MIWKRENIKDLTELFTDGDWIETKNQSVDGIRLIQTGNIGFGKFKPKEDKKRFISLNTFEKLKCKEIYPGDILTSRLPDPVGKSCIIPDVGERMITGVDCSIIRLKPHVDKVFFAYYQMSNEYLNEVNARVTGTTRSRISRKNLGQIKVPIPPLQEQKQIVETLDKAFEKIDKAIANTKQNLQNTKELFESYLQNVFENTGDDWEEKTLKQIAEVFGRGKSKHRPRNDKKLYGGNYPFIQTGDIRNSDHFIVDYKQTYNEVGLSQSKLWPKGTICITIAANIAETGILSFEACFPDSVIGIIVDNKQAVVDYVEYLLQYFKVNIQTLSQGSAQENINLGTFEGKLFPFPSTEEQQKIIKKLDNLSAETKKLKAIYSQKIADLEELKKSMLEKAFKGELTSAA
ncbi:restriction endonuclease subunit S [Flavobacteriaceae bacterium]|nr:restriction endonuclease subunit S [Flavobacteriaceae bacterium]